MKILVCITFILGSFLTLYAQGEAGISGKVSDVKGQPVSYANITLQRVRHYDLSFPLKINRLQKITS